MTGEPPVPTFSDAEVLSRLREAAKRGLRHCRQGDADLLDWGYDMETANELIAACPSSEVHKHEVSHHYPEKNDYVVILKKHLPDQQRPFYVKIALRLPTLEIGVLLSFHPWGHIR